MLEEAMKRGYVLLSLHLMFKYSNKGWVRLMPTIAYWTRKNNQMKRKILKVLLYTFYLLVI